MNLEEAPLNRIIDLLLAKKDDYGEIYLVGGFVRDYRLQKVNKDFDFVVSKNAANAARSIADYFRGGFYLLDYQRETARALIDIEDQRYMVDVAIINGENISEDLRLRDFTFNAMAVNLLDLNFIIDPLNGSTDLQNKKLKPCNARSFSDDPIRTLRAVRFIRDLSLDYDPEVKKSIINVSKQIKSISGERIRNELNFILNLPEIKISIKLMLEFELFNQLFPDLLHLKKISPLFPHVHNGLNHTFRVVELTQLFVREINDDVTLKSDNQFLNDVQLLFGKYKKELAAYFGKLIEKDVSLSVLLAIAALYHDSGKSFIPATIDGEKVLFRNHAEKSAKVVRERMKALAFSNKEIQFVSTIIRYHMTDKLKSIGEEGNSRRNVFRFFKETGDYGIMVGFFHLADVIATYEETLSSHRWNIALKSMERILDGWFNHYSDMVSPPNLIDGNDLIKEFGLQPGRELGKILDKVIEEQAAGIILDRSAAIKFADDLIEASHYK